MTIMTTVVFYRTVSDWLRYSVRGRRVAGRAGRRRPQFAERLRAELVAAAPGQRQRARAGGTEALRRAQAH